MFKTQHFRTATLSWLMAFVVLAHSETAVAWWDSGHRIVALIAWRQLEADERQSVLKVIGQHPQVEKYFTPQRDPVSESFRQQWVISQAAVWSDMVRKTDRDRPTWHYINRPLFGSPADERALRGRLTVNLASRPVSGATLATQDLNVIQAINLCRRLLKSHNTTPADRAICLTWLCHMVGDIHQPCHSTALFSRGRFRKGDRGGNDIPIVGKAKTINLHMYWDGQFGGGFSLTNDVRRLAADIGADRRLRDAGRRAARDLKPETWVAESHKIARQSVYVPSILQAVSAAGPKRDQAISPIQLSKDYEKQARRISRRRVVEAAHRLAAIFKTVGVAASGPGVE